MHFEPASVSSVTDQRETAGGELYPDLMGSPRMQGDPDERKHLILRLNGGQQLPFAESIAYAFSFLADDITFILLGIMIKVI